MPKQKRQLSADFPIHISGRCNNREHFPLPLSEVWEIFEDYLFLLPRAFEIEVLSFVLMPNHFHLLVRDPKLNLSIAMRFFMREIAKEILRKSGRINRLWGGEYHSTVVEGLDYYFTCYKYIYRNPVRAKIVNSVLAYEFSTLGVLLGKRKSIIPIAEDLTLFESPDQTIAWLEKPFEEEMNETIRKSLKKKTMRFEAVRSSRKLLKPEIPDFI